MLDLSRFDYSTYRRIIGRLNGSHANVTFPDVQSGNVPNHWYVLRHDVDYSPAAALRLAEVENDIGVRSIYFLLLNSPFYNLLGPDCASLPRHLIALGHQVGLHYDAAVIEKQGQSNVGAMVNACVQTLEAMSGKAVRCISMHNPSLFSGEDPLAADSSFINVYRPEFVRDVTYLSDSCGAWRDTAYQALVEGSLPQKIHFLTHPMFWDHQHASRWQRLAHAIELGAQGAQRWADEYAAHWRRHEGVREHDLRHPS